LRVALLAGGVGGAKMAHGLDQVLEPGQLTAIVNVSDDFELLGLHISPDLDTVMYTLAGLANAETGWGLAEETWTARAMLERFAAPTWFRIGDGDLATHVRRTGLIRDGLSLTDATRSMSGALGVSSVVLPASDDRVRSFIQTDDGELDFQTYFVRQEQAPEVRGIRLDGIDGARPTASVLDTVAAAELIVIGPSNPFVSIGPILALSGMRQALMDVPAAVVAVSPIVAGKALKGPADRMLASLGHEPSALGVARLYAGLADRFVLDDADAQLAPAVEELGMTADVAPTVMRNDEDRATLARRILDAVR
jgi:LPPG:FO 2-phospho-L-lactate transferase